MAACTPLADRGALSTGPPASAPTPADRRRSAALGWSAWCGGGRRRVADLEDRDFSGGLPPTRHADFSAPGSPVWKTRRVDADRAAGLRGRRCRSYRGPQDKRTAPQRFGPGDVARRLGAPTGDDLPETARTLLDVTTRMVRPAARNHAVRAASQVQVDVSFLPVSDRLVHLALDPDLWEPSRARRARWRGPYLLGSRDIEPRVVVLRALNGIPTRASRGMPRVLSTGRGLQWLFGVSVSLVRSSGR